VPDRRSSRTHQNERLIVVVHQFGDNGPFGLDFSTQITPMLDQTFESLEQAKAAADERVLAEGHDCDRFCSDWRDSN
jgi:hypothetical protein